MIRLKEDDGQLMQYMPELKGENLLHIKAHM